MTDEEVRMSNKAKLLALHGQLLAGDPLAASRIVELVIAPLAAIVSREVAGLESHQDAEEACFDALFKYLLAPGEYDPARSGLMTYLAAMAKGKAQTIRRAQSRRAKHEATFARESDGARPTDMGQTEDAMLRGIDMGRVLERFGDQLIKAPGDEMVFRLMAIGETSLQTYCDALGLAADEAGLAEAGKRVERMRGRVRRIGERMSA